jgi:hypothetical protein
VPTENPDIGGPKEGGEERGPGAEVEGVKWDKGGALKVVAAGWEAGGGREVPRGGPGGAGDWGMKGSGAEGCTGGRAG